MNKYVPIQTSVGSLSLAPALASLVRELKRDRQITTEF